DSACQTRAVAGVRSTDDYRLQRVLREQAPIRRISSNDRSRLARKRGHRGTAYDVVLDDDAFSLRFRAVPILEARGMLLRRLLSGSPSEWETMRTHPRQHPGSHGLWRLFLRSSERSSFS